MSIEYNKSIDSKRSNNSIVQMNTDFEDEGMVFEDFNCDMSENS